MASRGTDMHSIMCRSLNKYLSASLDDLLLFTNACDTHDTSPPPRFAISAYVHLSSRRFMKFAFTVYRKFRFFRAKSKSSPRSDLCNHKFSSKHTGALALPPSHPFSSPTSFRGVSRKRKSRRDGNKIEKRPTSKVNDIALSS
jgi:hypothetical protein